MEVCIVGAEQEDGGFPHLLTIAGIVVAALVLIYGASWWTARRIEQDLGARARAALSAAGIEATVRVAGRDATVVGTVTGPSQESTALTIVHDVWGVGRVTSGLQVVAPSDAAGTAGARPTPPSTPSAAPLWPQGSIGFESGSSALDAPDEIYLNSVIVYLRQYGSVNVVIRGFADNVGSPEANHELSQQRADAVVAYLATHGVGTGRLRTSSFGDGRPVTSNDTALGRSVNRRVELVFVEAN
jgi:outer membrane protein OmpA-like peptidoglycan-associated protein